MKHEYTALLVLATMLMAVSCVKVHKYDPEPLTVSEEDVQDVQDVQYTPAMTLIVTLDQKIKITLTTHNDKDVTDHQVRDALISKAVDIYNASGKGHIRMTSQDADRFAAADTIATPFQQMTSGEWEPVGLTVDDLPVWLDAARSVSLDTTLGPVADYFGRVAQGDIAIRTDKNIPYVYMDQIFDLMQSYGFSKFSLMTDLDND